MTNTCTHWVICKRKKCFTLVYSWTNTTTDTVTGMSVSQGWTHISRFIELPWLQFVYNAALLRSLSAMMLILLCLILFPSPCLHFCLTLERLINVWARALNSDSFASLLYLFAFWWSSHTSVHWWKEFLISWNLFRRIKGGKCGEQPENTDVDSIEWQMKNEWESYTWVCCTFPVKCQVPYISGRTHWTTRNLTPKTIICSIFWGWNRPMMCMTTEQKKDRNGKEILNRPRFCSTV